MKLLLTLLALTSVSLAADEPKLKALLILGGCCHDYATQKDLLKAGLEKRLPITVDVDFNPDKTTKASFARYATDDWAKGYDLVIHDECSADVKDVPTVERIVKAHRDGVPGINLHCAMHSYRVGQFREPVTPGSPDALWFDYIGLQSTGHGPQEPIAVTYVDKEHPITKGLADWTTIKEELYNNIAPLTSKALAKGKQTVTDKKTGEKKDVEAVVAWTNEYGPKKTRVFSTTLGHNNDTVGDARYLDLIANAVKWVTGK